MDLASILRIVSDARAQGLIVEKGRDSFTIRRSPRGVAFTLWENGTATRADVGFDLTAAAGVRSAKEVRRALGLEVRRSNRRNEQ